MQQKSSHSLNTPLRKSKHLPMHVATTEGAII